MAPTAGPFDPRSPVGIHLCLGLACALWVSACPDEPPRPEEPPPPADAGLAPQPSADDAADGSDGGDLATDDAVAPDRMSAEGKAPRGFDMGISRDLAAGAARRKLLKKMKDLGMLPPETRELQGSSVDRFWIQGRFVHAEVSVPWPEGPAGVNVPADVPSNSANLGRPTAAATPEGGPKP